MKGSLQLAIGLLIASQVLSSSIMGPWLIRHTLGCNEQGSSLVRFLYVVLKSWLCQSRTDDRTARVKSPLESRVESEARARVAAALQHEKKVASSLHDWCPTPISGCIVCAKCLQLNPEATVPPVHGCPNDVTPSVSAALYSACSLGHCLHILNTSSGCDAKPLLVCTKCGAYASRRARKLRKACIPINTAVRTFGSHALARVSAKRHPTAAGAMSDESIRVRLECEGSAFVAHDENESARHSLHQEDSEPAHRPLAQVHSEASMADYDRAVIQKFIAVWNDLQQHLHIRVCYKGVLKCWLRNR